MEELLAVYKKGGRNITKIHCDNEFFKVMDPFLAKQYLTIRINYAVAQEHVPRSEKIIASFKNVSEHHTIDSRLCIYRVFW